MQGMGISLADELAGATGSPSAGRSLADEFDLEFEVDEELDAEDLDEGAVEEEQPKNGLVPAPPGTAAAAHEDPVPIGEPVTPPRRAGPRKSTATLRAQESRQSTPYRTPRTPSTVYGTPIGAGANLSFGHHDHFEQATRVDDLEAQGGNALVVLSETLASTSRFLGSLRRLDAAPTPSSSHSAAAGAAAEDIEGRMQAHLSLMHDADRRAEEHIRTLATIERELSVAPLDDVDWSDVWDEYSLSLEEGDEGTDPGWTGTSRFARRPDSPTRIAEHLEPSISTHLPDEAEEADQRLDELMDDPFSPVEPLRSSGSGSGSGFPPPPELRVHGAEAALPRAVRLVQADTVDVLVALQGLGETLHLSGAVYNGVQRQMRGIRAGIDSWREREEQEAAAWTAVEVYDRERVQRGLSGENTRERLRREMDGFAECLEGLTRRLQPITA